MDTAIGYVRETASFERSCDARYIVGDSYPQNAPYNRSTFAFEHGLQGAPEFSLGYLRARILRNAQLARGTYWSNGPALTADPWRKGMRADSLLGTLDHIEHNDSLIMLRPVEGDEALGPLVSGLMRHLVELVGAPLREDMLRGRATLLIASPWRITSYHVDADTNFLFQIEGRKTFHVFDGRDRTLIDAVDHERYFMGDPNGARYRPERQSAAVTYDLRPGMVVHVPALAPHWAQNGDSVSVALSVNFDLASVFRASHVHRANHYLRRAGFTPRAPGQARWRDALKVIASGVLERARFVHRALLSKTLAKRPRLT